MTDAQGADVLVCTDCGRSIAWHSDEAREWFPVDDADRFGTLCTDCYRSRYGNKESRQFAKRTRDDQEDERASGLDQPAP
jgi:hypothetical protein